MHRYVITLSSVTFQGRMSARVPDLGLGFEQLEAHFHIAHFPQALRYGWY
jgi:hypothetical protein